MHMNCGCSVAAVTRGQKAHLRAAWQGEVKNKTSKSDHPVPAPEPPEVCHRQGGQQTGGDRVM